MKLLFMLLLCVSLLTPASVFAADAAEDAGEPAAGQTADPVLNAEGVLTVQPPAALRIIGAITAETEESITVTDRNDENNVVVLNLSPETYVINGATGVAMGLKDRGSEEVVAYYGPVMTRSMPPQSPAVLVICDNDPEAQPPVYGRVESLSETDGGVLATVQGGSLQVAVLRDNPIFPYLTRNIVTVDNIEVGSDLLMWYNFVAESYPAQATADRVVILGKARPTETEESTEAGEEPTAEEPPEEDGSVRDDVRDAIEDILSEEPVGFSLGMDKVVIWPVDGANAHYFPLRSVMEAFGYAVTWEDATRAAVMQKGDVTHTVTIGITAFSGGELPSVPVVIENSAYVPEAFFQSVGITVALEGDTVSFVEES